MDSNLGALPQQSDARPMSQHIFYHLYPTPPSPPSLVRWAEQRARQERGLVGTGDLGVRNAGRLPALLRRKPLWHLPENPRGQDRVPQVQAAR